MASFQRVTMKLTTVDRKDHVWFVAGEDRWKCASCGAITSNPPGYPTKPSWEPDYYERLTNDERALLPMVRS